MRSLLVSLAVLSAVPATAQVPELPPAAGAAEFASVPPEIKRKRARENGDAFFDYVYRHPSAVKVVSIIDGQLIDGKCEPDFFNQASATTFSSMTESDQQAFLQTTCDAGAAGTAYVADSDFIGVNVQSYIDGFVGRHEWSKLTNVQQGWLLQAVQDHEWAHIALKREENGLSLLQLSFNDSMVAIRIEEVIGDALAMCVAATDTVSPERGGWVASTITAQRQRFLLSGTHNTRASLQQIQRGNMLSDCASLGKSLPAGADARPDALRLVLKAVMRLPIAK